MGERTRNQRMVRHYEHDELTYRINGAAYKVHTALGPGLFEKVYEKALCVEFERQSIHYEQQKRIRVMYEGVEVGEMIIDLVVEDSVIVELKAVKELLPIHEAQLIAYLQASGIKTGLLMNFNMKSLKHGIRHFSN